MYREESFQGVNFKSLEDSISNNSSKENSLVVILIYYLTKKYTLLPKFMEYPLQSSEGVRYAFCDRIFEV